jgi:uncharacterized LabA/DUF88 family protein
MYKSPNNYAFIDGINLHLTFVYLGWQLDYGKLLSYLKKRHNITTAYYFIGFIKENQNIYDELIAYGYTLKFRSITKKTGKTIVCPYCGKPIEVEKGKIKCDCDADIVLQVMEQINNFDKAILITSDGDFDNLVVKLLQINKLAIVLAPSKSGCSHLLKIAAKGRIAFLDELRNEVEKV